MSGQVTLGAAPAAAPPPRRRRWTARRLWFLGLLTGALLAIASAGVVLVLPRLSDSGSNATSETAVPVAWGRVAVSNGALAQRSGVKITHVAVTGGGGLVDLRYQVVDPDKATALHDASTPPAVVDEQSGLVVHDLLMDHAHTGPFKAGVTYYYIFNNPGNWVHHASLVTVLLGNAQVEHVVVQ
jgi:hypothetical protein